MKNTIFAYMKCPKCSSSENTRAGTARGKQRYRCSSCNYFFTVEMRTQRIDAALKRKAIILYLEGFSSREVEQLTGIHHVSLLKWVREFGPKFRLLLNKQDGSNLISNKPSVKLMIPQNSWLLITAPDGSILYTHPGSATVPL